MRRDVFRCPLISWERLPCPRQPFSKVIPIKRGTRLGFGIKAIERRSDLAHLAAIVSQCLIMWPYVESEMAIVLGILLKANTAGILAVFQILRRSSNQRDALSEAARFTLDHKGQELLAAILIAHKSVEAERNAFAHGHLGACNHLKDGLVWMDVPNFIIFRVELHLKMPYAENFELNSKLASMAFVYRKDDLDPIYADIVDLWHIWLEFGEYLQLKHIKGRAEVYDRLCNRPRIAQALAEIRRKNNPSVTPRSPPRTRGG
jgi:hypothetical protein